MLQQGGYFLLPHTKKNLEYGLIKEKTFPRKNEVQKFIRKDTKEIQGHYQSTGKTLNIKNHQA
jgi:hypothetical protein